MPSRPTCTTARGTPRATGPPSTSPPASPTTPPTCLILAGDIGAGDDFDRCLALFERLPSAKGRRPRQPRHLGPHPTTPAATRSTSTTATCRPCAERYGFTYLDQGPLVFPESDLAVVGTMNWYDYSWDNDLLRRAAPDDWQERLRTKRFTRGMHNDANFVRWPFDDLSFTDRVVGNWRPTSTGPGRSGKRSLSPTTRRSAGCSTREEPLARRPALAGVLRQHAAGRNCYARTARIPLVFCGHTHAARECEVGGMRGFNVGGDYHFKRLLWVDWPSGKTNEEEFR